MHFVEKEPRQKREELVKINNEKIKVAKEKLKKNTK